MLPWRKHLSLRCWPARVSRRFSHFWLSTALDTPCYSCPLVLLLLLMPDSWKWPIHIDSSYTRTSDQSPLRSNSNSQHVRASLSSRERGGILSQLLNQSHDLMPAPSRKVARLRGSCIRPEALASPNPSSSRTDNVWQISRRASTCAHSALRHSFTRTRLWSSDERCIRKPRCFGSIIKRP